MTSKINYCIALAATLLLCCASQASAGTYKVYSCKLPSGGAAPTDGWHSTGGATYSTFTNGCAAGGSMSAVLGGQIAQPAGNFIGWGFDSGDAPIVGYSIHRAGTSTGTGGWRAAPHGRGVWGVWGCRVRLIGGLA